MLLNSFILTGLFIVSCLVVQTFANGAIRLVDGNDASEGRVEVLQNGQWGTICDDGWDIADAHVVCRQLGLGYAVSASGQGRFGRGSGAIAMDEVNCAGNEERLEDCSFRGWFLHDCIHQEDAGVRCSTADGGLRLVGGNSIHEGRVEYYRGGAWGTICDDNWDENDAAVACRSLGFSQPAVAFDSAHFGEGTGAIVLSNVDCDGTETSLDECNEKQGSVIDCLHSEDAGVRCTPILISTTPRCNDYDVRIRGGTAVSDGLVEVCYKGFWGTVCANSWKKEDAFAVCRQLGYNVVETFYSRVSSNNVPDQTVGHLSCRAGSVTLSNCDLTFGYQDGCSLNAGVTCAKEERCIEGQVQLVGGNSASSGRVQFCQAGETVNICGTSWEYNEARLVCRQLGYSSVSDYSSVIANHGIVSNSALRVLSCQGTEVSLSQCHIRPDSYCTRQATVTCGRQNGGGNGNGNDDVINDNDDRGSSTVVVYALPPSLLGVIIFLCLCYLWCWCNSDD